LIDIMLGNVRCGIGLRLGGVFLALLLSVAPAFAQTKFAVIRASSTTSLDQVDAGGLCEAAIQTVERQAVLPARLLTGVGIVESGRVEPGGRVRPWPWSAQANDTSHYFATKAEAVAWVLDAQAHGVTSIDVGCLQVNLLFHPQAFESVDAAFDPVRNVSYGARFLAQLYAETRNWDQAIGFYHSRTPVLAAVYQQRVQQVMTGRASIPPQPVPVITVAAKLGSSWRATLDPVPAPANLATGKSWNSLLAVQSAPISPVRKPKMQFAAR
jgi:hypothetical protein